MYVIRIRVLAPGAGFPGTMRRYHWLAAIGVIVLALVPRVWFALSPHPPLFSDMEDYDRTAVNFLMGNGLVMSQEYRAYRPPGYPLFLAAVYSIFGRNVALVRVLQAFLSACACGLLFLFAWHVLADEKSGWARFFVCSLASIMLALYEPNIFLAGVFLSESLFIFVLLVFVLFLCGQPKSSRLSLCAASVLLGILVLVRPVAIAYLPALLVGAATQRRPGGYQPALAGLRTRMLRAGLCMLFFVLTVLPWTIRNALVLHAFVPVSTNAGVNFYIGHHLGYSYWSTGAKERIRAETDLDEVAESRLFFLLGWEYIKGNPKQTLLDTWKKAEYLFRPGIPPWPMGDRGYDLVLAGCPWLRDLFLVWNWFFLVLWPVGAVLTWVRLPQGRPVVILVTCHALATLVFFARARFRAPIEPFLLFWVSVAVVYGLAWPAGQLERWIAYPARK